jgi:hypothetical protein
MKVRSVTPFAKLVLYAIYQILEHKRFTVVSASMFPLCLQHKIDVNHNKTFKIAKPDLMQPK